MRLLRRRGGAAPLDTAFSRERELHLEVLLAEQGHAAPTARPAAAAAPSQTAPAPPPPTAPAPPSADGDRTEDTPPPGGDAFDDGDATPR